MPERFGWNPRKARLNLQKHGVSFDEACSLFDDPMFITVLDEERYISIGISVHARLILIAHTERDGVTRVISARKATVHERQFYEEGH